MNHNDLEENFTSFTDVDGSYTGNPMESGDDHEPVQDADDL